MISLEKQTLRLCVRESLRAMEGMELAEKSAVIAGHLAERLGGSGVIFGFAPLRSEPDWMGAIGSPWRAAFPRIEGKDLRFHLVTNLSGFVRGPLGVREPGGGEEIPLDAADVILVPGVAFDRSGARLGRGGGYYDRVLGDAALSARRIAVCFACQVVERVPIEPHDARVDAIVTEDGWIEVRNSEPDRD